MLQVPGIPPAKAPALLRVPPPRRSEPSLGSMLCNKGAMASRERVGKGIDKVSSGRLDTTKTTGHTSDREEIP